MKPENSMNAIIVNAELLRPVIFNQYFEAKINTEAAAEILNISIPDFVELYDKWIESYEVV